MVVSLDFPKAQRISRDFGILSGTLAFSSSYSTGGESATDITKYFKECNRVVCDAKGGYIFEWDKTNKKIKVLYPRAASSHTHTENTAATYTQNATTASANIAAAAGAEVPNGTDLSSLTGVSFIAIGRIR